MKEYLLLFRDISGDNAYITTPQDMAEDMPAWQAWIGNIAMQGKLVSTQPIEYYGQVVSKQGISEGPDKTERNLLVAGYLICKAETLQEVQQWSKTCPMLKYENGSVEIRPIIPFPTI
ncbi:MULTISPECIES: YciI family protein [unclassified Arcicella]|uniref:YciI family protein n=1 Tax=unclassified Arcicella TaxID=2644986 RepID=UPI00285F9C05|nr:MULTISPECIES: YciI family protein [unclassified Arcicella]MDR6563050.1 hypothetical protein [Arcicella sp. BE51]MDR6813134.1 hypothetical protein [Arcicella sp. BE140]MDR6824448.1 hypothetical protein [Arcicella sp. BE139]